MQTKPSNCFYKSITLVNIQLSSRKFNIYSNAFFQFTIVSEYDQEIPQSQTADNPKAPRGRATQPSRDTRETN